MGIYECVNIRKQSDDMTGAEPKSGEGSFEKEITSVLKAFGISPCIKGYGYITEMVSMVRNDIGLLEAVTKELYLAVAYRNGTCAGNIERAVRYAVKTAWERNTACGLNEKSEYAGWNHRPTNREFIAMLVEKLN